MTAVIVNWNARDHLLRCVASLRADGVGSLVVVDNNSADGSANAIAAADPDAIFLSTGSNLGFGAAVNRGVKDITTPFVLILNPDTVVVPGTVAVLAAALAADDTLGVVGPRVDRLDGTIYPSARRFPTLGVAIGHAFVGLLRPNNRFTRN
ncbi:MAG: glycosyltransferase, partial [Pseudonocardiaceae bacterium]